MATTGIVPSQDRAQYIAGKQGSSVIGNSTGALNVSTGAISSGAKAETLGYPTANTGSLIPTTAPVNQQQGPIVHPIDQQGTTPIGTPAATSNATANSPLANYTPQQTQQLQKQLIDIYGKGIGEAYFNELTNLGSGNSTFLQAYKNAMAPENAQGAASLNTTLGNSGIGMDSSTAAIANASYQTGIVGQEGLQEAQLQQNEASQAINMTSNTLGAGASEVGYSGFYNFLSQVAGDVGAVLGGSGPGASGPKTSAPSVAGTASNSQQTIDAAGTPSGMSTVNNTSQLGVIPLESTTSAADAGIVY